MAVTINGSAGVTTNSGAVYNSLQSGTAVSASGTSIDFTSIPSWVKRITVMFSGVSTNGTSFVQVQIGSGSVSTSGYVSSAFVVSGAGVSSSSATSGFVLGGMNVAADVRSGHVLITNISGNIWVASIVIGNGANTTTDVASVGGGNITLSGTLDRVRITTVNGTDTFDAGSINIIYE